MTRPRACHDNGGGCHDKPGRTKPQQSQNRTHEYQDQWNWPAHFASTLPQNWQPVAWICVPCTTQGNIWPMRGIGRCDLMDLGLAKGEYSKGGYSMLAILPFS